MNILRLVAGLWSLTFVSFGFGHENHSDKIQSNQNVQKFSGNMEGKVVKNTAKEIQLIILAMQVAKIVCNASDTSCHPTCTRCKKCQIYKQCK